MFHTSAALVRIGNLIPTIFITVETVLSYQHVFKFGVIYISVWIIDIWYPIVGKCRRIVFNFVTVCVVRTVLKRNSPSRPVRNWGTCQGWSQRCHRLVPRDAVDFDTCPRAPQQSHLSRGHPYDGMKYSGARVRSPLYGWCDYRWIYSSNIYFFLFASNNNTYISALLHFPSLSGLNCSYPRKNCPGLLLSVHINWLQRLYYLFATRWRVVLDFFLFFW